MSPSITNTSTQNNHPKCQYLKASIEKYNMMKWLSLRSRSLLQVRFMCPCRLLLNEQRVQWLWISGQKCWVLSQGVKVAQMLNGRVFPGFKQHLPSAHLCIIHKPPQAPSEEQWVTQRAPTVGLGVLYAASSRGGMNQDFFFHRGRNALIRLAANI